jgi:uncharacterized membrane protein (UPF0127 family)
MQVAKVVDTTRGTVVGDHIEIADTSSTRGKGLLGRTGLDAGAGLWIKPCSGVHMFGMKFAIDVIGLDGDRKVIKLWPNLKPWRMSPISLRLRSVIELPAGRIAECEVTIGDQRQIA